MKLKNQFTTPEQSQRLLEVGLPADSADLGIIDDVMNKDIEVLHIPYSQWCKGYENISVPCWSVGRLIELLTSYWEKYRNPFGGHVDLNIVSTHPDFVNILVTEICLNINLILEQLNKK